MDGTNFNAQPNELRSQPARSILMRLFGDVTSLVNQEYQLVRTELGQKRGAMGRAAVSGALAVALGLLALVCVTVAVIAELAIALGLAYAALVVAVLYAVIAFVLAQQVQRGISSDRLSLTHAAGQIPKTAPSTKTIPEQLADLDWTRRRIDETLTALERKNDLVQPLRDTAVGMGALGVAVANIVRADAKAAAGGR
jgi:uncharacterized membrane protein YqjE